jgi:hypothetical protein
VKDGSNPHKAVIPVAMPDTAYSPPLGRWIEGFAVTVAANINVEMTVIIISNVSFLILPFIIEPPFISSLRLHQYMLFRFCDNNPLSSQFD